MVEVLTSDTEVVGVAVTPVADEAVAAVPLLIDLITHPPHWQVGQRCKQTHTGHLSPGSALGCSVRPGCERL